MASKASKAKATNSKVSLAVQQAALLTVLDSRATADTMLKEELVDTADMLEVDSLASREATTPMLRPDSKHICKAVLTQMDTPPINSSNLRPSKDSFRLKRKRGQLAFLPGLVPRRRIANQCPSPLAVVPPLPQYQRRTTMMRLGNL